MRIVKVDFALNFTQGAMMLERENSYEVSLLPKGLIEKLLLD
jgi:hypothetical protein